MTQTVQSLEQPVTQTVQSLEQPVTQTVQSLEQPVTQTTLLEKETFPYWEYDFTLVGKDIAQARKGHLLPKDHSGWNLEHPNRESA